jgi:Flp pilus assembly protein TadD
MALLFFFKIESQFLFALPKGAFMKQLLCVCLVLAFAATALPQARGKEGLIMTQIKGQVFLSDGRPAGEGIQILLEPSGGGTREMQTDRQGKFTFESLSPTRYTVRAHMPGFIDVSQSFDMSVMSSAYATLTLRAVSRESSAPAAGVVSVLPSDMPDALKAEFNAGYNIIVSGKDLGKAVPHFKKVIEHYQTYAPAYMLLGTAYVESGKDSDAIGPLQKAIELDPKLSDSYSVLGKIYNKQKKYSEAEQNLNKAVELAPGSYDAQYELGRALFFLQKTPEAHPHADAALKANPKSPEAHLLMGNIMLRERNAEGALAEYHEALRLNPKGPMSGPTNEMVTKIENALKQSKK